MTGVTARIAAATVGLLAACAAALPGATGAVVPPQDCGRLTVAAKRFQVKADQLTCTAGRKYAKAYLTAGRKPRGYTCKRYPAKRDRVAFYCNDGAKIFFAIRR